MTGLARSLALALPLLLAALAAAPIARAEAEPEAEPEAILAALRGARLAPQRAVEVQGLSLDAGMARLVIERGVLVPAVPADLAVADVSELVFLGRARLVLEPPDDVEAGQLELFTGSPRLAAEISEAVLTVADEAAVEILLDRPRDTGHDAARAEAIYEAWRASAERRQLNLESALIVDALGDPLSSTYFAGWFRSQELGDFLYLVEPWTSEAVTLGQFVPIELSEKERRKIARVIHRSQRKGRLIGLTVDDLGQWDTWVSVPLSSEPAGRQRPAPFEPRHYQLEVRLEGRDLDLVGSAKIELVAGLGGTRTARLRLHTLLTLESVSDATGQPLRWHRSGDEVVVWLGSSPAAGEAATIELRYRGKMVDKAASGSFRLIDTLGWYPHAGILDVATYDITFHWPERLDLVTGGARVDGGTGERGTQWERRRIETPTMGASFEVGKLKIVTTRAGHVQITLAFEPHTYGYLKEAREELLATLADSLTFFEETFGPYPLDELTVVTVSRDFSQAMLGYVTLSTLMMSDLDLLTLILGLEDRRTVIAHELAHQWWGHQLGWRSYRDQWISEAMANYSALLYACQRLGGSLRFAIGPTAGWQRALRATTADGRPVESLGPLVLGERLESSRSSEAYDAIVYYKGAVVLDMLSRLLGEERFLGFLRKILDQAGGGVVSTEEFFAMLERLSGADLDPFARLFVYGTGLPEVYYDYRVDRGEGGKWKVWVGADQRSPYRWRYRVIERLGGGFDIAREAIEQMDVSASLLAVPFQIAVDAPQAGTASGMAVLNGRLLLEGERSEMEIEIDYEPKELWLDRKHEVFGRFYNRRRWPKRVRVEDGIDLLAAGRFAEGEAALREALESDVFAGAPAAGDGLDEDELREQGHRLDGMAEALLARHFLDQDRDEDARAALAAAGDHFRRAGQKEVLSLVAVEARLALRAGDADRAFKLLRRSILKRGDLDSTEGFVLLAIAARAVGDRDVYRMAAEEAEEKGADLSLLVRPAA